MLKQKIIHYIYERKWLIAVIITLIFSLFFLVIKCNALTNQINEMNVSEISTSSTESEKENIKNDKEEKETDPEKTKTTDSTTDIDALIEENKKLKKMLQNQTEDKNIEIKLKTAAVKFIDANYNYDEKEITAQERENIFKQTVTSSYYKKLRPDNVGNSAFVMMTGETGTYNIKSIYYSDIYGDEPAVAIIYSTEIKCPSFDEPIKNTFFQAFNLAFEDNEWKVNGLIDTTTP